MANYQKVILDGWQFQINPTTWKEAYVDKRIYKRSINGTLNQIGTIKKKAFSFEGWNKELNLSDVWLLEDRYKTGGQYSLTTPAGETYTIILTRFERTFSDKVVVKYSVEAEEV